MPVLHSLPPLLQKYDEQSRYDWSVMAAGALLGTMDQALRDAVVAGGEAAFVSKARISYAAQDFKDADLKRIFYFIQRPKLVKQILEDGSRELIQYRKSQRKARRRG